jgi:hypothetical protein
VSLAVQMVIPDNCQLLTGTILNGSDAAYHGLHWRMFTSEQKCDLPFGKIVAKAVFVGDWSIVSGSR